MCVVHKTTTVAEHRQAGEGTLPDPTTALSLHMSKLLEKLCTKCTADMAARTIAAYDGSIMKATSAKCTRKTCKLSNCRVRVLHKPTVQDDSVTSH